ncbi:MAG: PHP domain-containing protein [Kiritimatiellia bacterium]
MIDLHIHSRFSDGSLTPEEIVEKAEKAGLTALALTDHDCVDGVERMLRACSDRSITGIPGVEISSEVKKGTLHMLGYYIDIQNKNLKTNLEKIRRGRDIRNTSILARLNELGLNIAMEDVRSYAGEEVVGRPHFAMALMEHGYVRSKKEAFDLYLAKGRDAYVDRFRLSPGKSVELIRGAGGIPVLAHPFTLELDSRPLKDYVRLLKEHGLCGIEVYYPEHNDAQQKFYMQIAKELDLIVTGGTDFHGEINPGVRIGVGFGSLNVPDGILREMEKLRR